MKDLQVIENYREEIKYLKEIKDRADYLKRKAINMVEPYAGNLNTVPLLESIMDNTDKVIVNTSEAFIKMHIDSLEEYHPKLGYAFTWLTKLENAHDDCERENIMKEWLDEINKNSRQ